MVPNLQIPDTPSDTPAGDTTPHPDAELIELERALKFAPETASLALQAYEDADAAADAEMPECPVKTPAISLDGLAVKRRLSEKLSEDWDIAEVHQHMMSSLFESAERCMKGGRS